jgi:hypothetical protein
MRTLRHSLLIALMLGAPLVASANPISLAGVSDPTLRASVLLAYTGTNATSGLLTLTIGNTSTAYNPALTGFAFNAPTNVTGVTSFTSSLSKWSYSYSPNNINTPGNYGSFDIAGITGPNFNGGKPNNGIQKGGSASFTFTLSGTNMNLLTVSSFLALNSAASNQNSSPQTFIARFQRTGANGQGSDVAIPVPPPPTQVPEPSTLLLSSGALAGLFWHRRRRKN